MSSLGAGDDGAAATNGTVEGSGVGGRESGFGTRGLRAFAGGFLSSAMTEDAMEELSFLAAAMESPAVVAAVAEAAMTGVSSTVGAYGP